MRKVSFMLLAMVAMLVFTVAGCSAAKKSGIEGKAVDGKGQPMKGIKLIAKQVQPIKGYEHFETTTGADGTFKFKGLFPSSEYTIEPWFESGKAVGKVKIQSGPEGQTSMLDKPFEIRFTQSLAGIVTDSKTGLQWVPSNGQAMNWFQANEWVHSFNNRNLEFEGGGWRLPTVSELRQIRRGDPVVNSIQDVWTSESCPPYAGQPGHIAFLFGNNSELCTTIYTPMVPSAIAVRTHR